MAFSINRVTILGNLGADPEYRDFQSGARMCRLRMATSERWRDRNSGENREQTEWHTVCIFNENIIRIIEQYVHKGDKIYIEGKLVTRKWQDQQGQDRYTTEIQVQNYGGQVILLGNRSGNTSLESDNYSDSKDSSSPQNDPYSSSNIGNSEATKISDDISLADDDDDEIPF